ncbi:uncharacterized protein [Zea mays]|jgi:hypothetical protein|uniref:Uncharacterized protein n=1 Tax=Zea mays TaxID=4577 RepID=A0A804QKQ8_MAIZE|nr:uncharacterized protein LOC103634646 isoform X1 [Zea mays]|eukprot:XP_008655465.1 uncharacterized protein LOC103634646 isoform X1 [Zea mays]
MASPSTEAPPLPTLRDVIAHDDDDDHFIAEEEEDEEWDDMSKRMSRLSMEGSEAGDADDEDDGGEDEGEEDDDEFDDVRSDVNAAATYRAWPPRDEPQQAPSAASLPGTPDRGAQAPWWPGPSAKGYASETEARWPPGADGRGGRRQRQRMAAREVWLERAWRTRKQRRQLQEEVPVPVVVLGGGGGDSPASRGVAMDMEEVRACRDLGLDLPCDWTVEIPSCALSVSGVDTASSGGNSPASGSWRISSPGNRRLNRDTPAQSLTLITLPIASSFLFCCLVGATICFVNECSGRSACPYARESRRSGRADEVAPRSPRVTNQVNSSPRARPFGIKPTGTGGHLHAQHLARRGIASDGRLPSLSFFALPWQAVHWNEPRCGLVQEM